jgi:hypothetical protein
MVKKEIKILQPLEVGKVIGEFRRPEQLTIGEIAQYTNDSMHKCDALYGHDTKHITDYIDCAKGVSISTEKNKQTKEKFYKKYGYNKK